MCDGKAKFTTTTDSHGDFVIARVLPVTSTAIIGTDKSLVGQLVGCSVSAVLPGFDSSQLTIANRDVLARPNIGTITLKRESGAAGTALSTTTATAPKSAMKSFEKARSDYEYALSVARQTQDGIMEWQSLLDIGCLWAGRDYAQAGHWFRRSLDLAQEMADSNLRARSLNRIGNWLVNTGRVADGLQAHQEALAMFETLQDTHGMA